MQSNKTRALVALGSIAVIVVLFVVLSGGDDEGGTPTTADLTTTKQDAGASKGGGQTKPAKPQFATILIRGGEPQGGVQDLTYSKGDAIRLEVKSDVAEEVHVHGYDKYAEVEAGGTVKLKFPAEIEGVFEVELEQTAVPIAQLTVKP